MTAPSKTRPGLRSDLVLPEVRFGHLRHLTSAIGLFEHAHLDEPRRAHGLTTDDNARAVVVMARSRYAGMPVSLDPYLGFVIKGRVDRGWHNRMSSFGHWTDERGPDDSHGRAIWALGEVVAAGVREPDVIAAFASGLDLETPHLRANCYAAIGAARAISSRMAPPGTSAFLSRIAGVLPHSGDGSWPWPETRLTYDNARVPQAMIEAGAALGDSVLVGEGLELLAWLVETETGPRGFSFTPVGGRGPDSARPAFDQQPIEAWAMADACLAATRVSDVEVWAESLFAAASWFVGANDAGLAMYDPNTGAGFDGLEASDINRNRGAESTLAAIGAMQAWALHDIDKTRNT